ncbi:hypothetical protein ACQP1W_22060 [Spirillospora sp. CA-255316]
MPGEVHEETAGGLADDPHGQIFVLLGWAWDVATAARLAAGYSGGRVRVERLAWLLTVIRTDSVLTRTLDLSRPLLAVPIPTTDEPLVIDGWHRIHHAIQTGVAELPIVVLTDQDERACRIMGGSIARPGAAD